MITSITPYLNFNTCEDALQFYVQALGAEIKSMMRVSDGPKEYQSPETNNKIMHAELKVGGSTILASDAMGHPIAPGANMSLTLNFENAGECEAAWSKMKEGAVITMNLEQTFWAVRYGQLQDKFGINWMFNCEK